MELLLGDIRHYEKWILLSVIAGGTIIWLLHLAVDKKRRNDSDKHG